MQSYGLIFDPPPLSVSVTQDRAIWKKIGCLTKTIRPVLMLFHNMAGEAVDVTVAFWWTETVMSTIFVDIRTTWKVSWREDSESFFIGCELNWQISGTDCWWSETRRVLTFKAKLILRQMSLLRRCKKNRKTYWVCHNFSFITEDKKEAERDKS